MRVEIKEGSNIYFSQGIKIEQVNELINYAREDPKIGHFTSDTKRFTNIDSFYKWLEGGKTIYTLSDAEGKLSGIIWFGIKNIPAKNLPNGIDDTKYPVTFAIRTYSSSRGKGLGLPFMRKAINEFREEFKTNGLGIWLEVSKDNTAAIKLYKSSGFRMITEPDEKGKVIMILDPDNLSSN